MTTRHFSAEEKLEIVLELNKGTPISHVCKTYPVNPKSVREWKEKYEKHGWG
ncbi:transposase [Salinicoccus sp. HZC-1]|uniref:transposase n=1 Tax=Salinicoccus sp. HZC-1 TaxID=3385497 RepID=UPI00398AE098